MKFLLIPAALFIGFSAQAKENPQELNLSDNYNAISLSEMREYMEKGANAVASLTSDTYQSAKALAKKYGPTIWSGIVEYGPGLVRFFIENQEKIFSAADGIQKYLAKDAPKETTPMITDDSNADG